jgi:hypothetical protein
MFTAANQACEGLLVVADRRMRTLAPPIMIASHEAKFHSIGRQDGKKKPESLQAPAILFWVNACGRRGVTLCRPFPYRPPFFHGIADPFTSCRRQMTLNAAF